MSTGSTRRLSPLAVRMLRVPAALYDRDLGWLLGRRFLRLTHVGRRSGRRYQTVLEVIGEDRLNHELFVIAGFGRSAQWYRNVRTGRGIEVAIGRERFAAGHRELDPEAAAAVLAAYERRNRFVAPVVRRVLSWLVGWRYEGTDEQRLQLVRALPVIGLRPASPTPTA